MYMNTFSRVLVEFLDVRCGIRYIDSFSVGRTNRKGYTYIQNEELYQAMELYHNKRKVVA